MAELTTKSIKGLEIFSTGKWNGDTYTAADLDQMVEAYDKTGWQPTVKAGHQDAQEKKKVAVAAFGQPALGYVERIYRVGSKLMADLGSIPSKFYDLVRAGAYKRVSSEVFWNYKLGDGKILPRVLKAVAFLGADIPAITNLDAVRGLYQYNGHEFRLVTYNLKASGTRRYEMENFGELLNRYNTGNREAGAEVDRLVKENQNGAESYSDTLGRLSRESKNYSGPVGRLRENIPKRYQAGIDLDKRAQELVLTQNLAYNVRR